MDTLLLDTSTWDLVVDVQGDIAVASNPYQLAQDAASFVRLFRGELYYDQTQGVPYWETILGHFIPLPLVKYYINTNALQVIGLIAAQSFITLIQDRVVRGQLQVTDNLNNVTAVNF